MAVILADRAKPSKEKFRLVTIHRTHGIESPPWTPGTGRLSLADAGGYTTKFARPCVRQTLESGDENARDQRGRRISMGGLNPSLLSGFGDVACCDWLLLLSGSLVWVSARGDGGRCQPHGRGVTHGFLPTQGLADSARVGKNPWPWPLPEKMGEVDALTSQRVGRRWPRCDHTG